MQTEVKTTSTNATVARYEYDGSGKRVKKIVGSEITIFVYNAAGQLVAEYAINQPSQPTTKTSYLTSDHLGSPRITTDSAGAVKSRHDYMAFGQEIQAGIGGRSTTQKYVDDSIRQQYTGYERDTESGLDYAQARYYSSQHGRFTSVDPLMASASIKNPQTFNRYSYALNSPYKFTDPLGLAATNPQCGNGGRCDTQADDYDEGFRYKQEALRAAYLEELSRQFWAEAGMDMPGDALGEFAPVEDSSDEESSETSEPYIQFDKIQVTDSLELYPDPIFINSTTDLSKDPDYLSSGVVEVDVSKNKPDKGGLVGIRVTFDVKGDATLNSKTNVYFVPKNGRWKLDDDRPKGAVRTDFATTSGVIVAAIKLQDIKAGRNTLFIEVSASYERWGKKPYTIGRETVTVKGVLKVKLTGVSTSVSGP
jgi:RHS repeat-associated protein